MKKIVILLISAFFTFSIFAASAEVVSITGKVEVAKGDSWVALKVGDKVEQSQTISTGFQSECKLKFNDSIMQIGALTRISLDRLADTGSKEVVDVSLKTGSVRSTVNHSADKRVNYTVKSPVAVASVRGTEFGVYDFGLIDCTSGAVAVAPARAYGDEKANTEAEAVEEPADGESTSTTAASDIDPYSPAGAVVVAANQQSTVSASGTVSTPHQQAVAKVVAGKAAVSTAAASSSEGMGAAVVQTTAAVPVVAAPVVVPVAPVTSQTGSIAVEITYE